MKNCKKFKTIDLTTGQRKRFSHYRYITNIMLNHAVLCTENWCWCHASSFNDAIADYKYDAEDGEKMVIEEILRKEY